MQRPEMIKQLKDIILSIKKPHPVRVGIDGVDGAGKTFLADELAKAIHERSVIRSSIDGFHNPKEVRYKRGRLSPEGYYHDSFDYQQLVEVLLKPLGTNNDLLYRIAIFDHHTDSSVDATITKARDSDILIMDGIFLSRPELRDFWDMRVFVDVPFSLTVPRAILRDGRKEETKEQYEKRYVPGQELYFRECHPKESADVIVDNSDFQNPSLRVLRDVSTFAA